MSLENYQTQRSDVLNDFENALRSKIDDPQTVSAVLVKIQSWAGRQPFLNRLLCNYVLTKIDAIARRKDAEMVDTIVQKRILKNWQKGGAANHLNQIQKSLLDYDDRGNLLILYLQILQRGSLTQKATPAEALLLRTGLVSLKNGQLSVSNAIYANVFNESWMERHLPGITKPVKVIKGSAEKHSEPGRFSGLISPSTQSSQLPLKTALLACGLTLLMVAAFIYLRKPNSGFEGTANKVSTAVAQPAVATPQTAIQLTLLGDTFSGYSTFRSADFQSVLQLADITLDYANEFDQSLRAQKLNQGDADLMVTTLDQFLQQQPKGKIVGLLDRTVGADAVVLNNKQYDGLTSLIDLSKLAQQANTQGKKLSITYAADTPSEYLALVLDAQLDNFNLADFDLKPVADASEAWDLMKDPEENVAIAVLWEPYVAQARRQGYNVVLSSRDAPSVIVDVLVASDRLIQSNPDVISQLLEKYYRRIDANIRNASQLQTQIAEDGELSAGDAATVIAGIDFFTATEAKSWLSEGTLTRRIDSTAAILTLSDRLASMPDSSSELYTDRFITEAANNTQALIDLIKVDNPELASKLAGTSPTALPTVPGENLSQGSSDIGNFQVRGQVSFNMGSAQLTPEGQKVLLQVASELKTFNQETIAVRVIGHTSRSGDASANLTLSQRRAAVVAEQLRNAGVKLAIQSEGKGFSEPLANTAPADARNQRTEIRLVRVLPKES